VSPKQKRFVQEYLIDSNATAAAIRAGYSRQSARQSGSDNLRKPEVAKAIAAAREKLAGKLEVTAEAIVAELAKLGFSNMSDYMRVDHDGYPHLDFGALTRDQAAALASVEVEEFVSATGEVDEDDKPIAPEILKVRFKLADKRAALVDLGKHLGLFKQQVEHDVADPLKKLFETICGRAFRPTGDGSGKS